jgi:hypothetical protein
MKFRWFNLMPWPDLPETFRQDTRSVWVDIPGRLYESTDRVAEEFAMLDVISGGWLIAGFPYGVPVGALGAGRGTTARWKHCEVGICRGSPAVRRLQHSGAG